MKRRPCVELIETVIGKRGGADDGSGQYIGYQLRTQLGRASSTPAQAHKSYLNGGLDYA